MIHIKKDRISIELAYRAYFGVLNMWRGLSLRARIYSVVVLLILITFAGGLVTVWSTYRMESLLEEIIERDVAGFKAAEALQISLVNQKGFVSYYFLDGNPDWLRQLGEYRQIFEERLKEVRATARNRTQERAIQEIESEYRQYIALKDKVIEHYQKGERVAGAALHQRARDHFFRVLDLCEQYKALTEKRMAALRRQSVGQTKRLRIIAATGALLVMILALVLVLVLIREILRPVRRLAMEAHRNQGPEKPKDEFTALRMSVHDLIEDIDQTHHELEKSREHLLQTEKMAMVGKLAAGTAHSIRNPLTSVKMRLFSLGRTLRLSPPQKEDFDVISEEIGHIDTIVQNFLEFSRPPKLKMQKVSPSEVVDLTLRLLKHRLQSYDVHVVLERKRPLPEVPADPEQLKEVLVNLIENACEAMGQGGSILIHEEETFVPPLGQVAVVRLADTGQGIPKSTLDKVFEPFFTTKEEGSGLGLSIALRIVEEHGGWLDVSSTEGEGTTFVLTLPIAPARP